MAAARNPVGGLEPDVVREAAADRSALERRAAELASRAWADRDRRTRWLLRAVTFLDLTSLSGDETPERVRRLCARARRPVRDDLLEALGVVGLDLRVAAVCVPRPLVPVAVEALGGSGIPVATVAAGFPSGRGPLPGRLDEIADCVEAGAEEIDATMDRALALDGQWERLYGELRAFRRACGEARLKVILGTGELGTLENVARATHVAMMAGADFIKTSTGKEAVNATLPAGLAMARAIREHHERTGHRVGFKPAGGIRRPGEALAWLRLVKEELGDAWLRPRLFRFGASSLLAAVVRELERHAVERRR